MCFYNELHPKVWNIVSQLATNQTLEVLSILTEEVTSGTLGEGADPEGWNPAIRALEVEYLRLVSTGRPPLPAGAGRRLHQVLGSQGLSGRAATGRLLHSLRVSGVRGDSELNSQTFFSGQGGKVE